MPTLGLPRYQSFVVMSREDGSGRSLAPPDPLPWSPVNALAKVALLCLAVVLPSLVTAGEPDVVSRQEIAHLISYLGSSGCRFNRNGSWYTSARASSHLRRKYEYLLDEGLVPDAEAFIERAATGSSVSGKPYLVMCGQSAPVRSAAWLREELTRLRAVR